MRKKLRELLETIIVSSPEAWAKILGSSQYPNVHGQVGFYPAWGGSLIVVELMGLPNPSQVCRQPIFGFHVHAGSQCTGNTNDPFADANGHFNPDDCFHPEHAGDLPPIFGADGYGLSIFFTNRFAPEELIGRTLILHGMTDDFTTQPSGNSGIKIACGAIRGAGVSDFSHMNF